MICDGKGPAKNRNDMIREQFFLPAGTQLNYSFIGLPLLLYRQRISQKLGIRLDKSTLPM